MEDKNNIEEEKVSVRHTINAEETFTLAKDVFDIRCLIKNVYNNRAVIARRINICTLSVSLVFTLLYVAYMLFLGILNKVTFFAEIALYCLLGVYGALFITLLILTLCAVRAKTKNVRKLNKALSAIRLTVRLVSIVLTIVAFVFAVRGGDDSSKFIAFNVILIIFSVICFIVQIIPVMAGGIGRLSRWLLSPVKVKYRFSTVALEWYELAVTDGGDSKAVKRVSEKYFDDIGRCLDNFLIPAFGKKYISAIKPSAVLTVADRAPEEDRALTEGVLKNVFAYATECGYVTFDPCRDLKFEGSIEEEEKQKSTAKSRLMGIGKKIGMSILEKYINKNTEDKDN